MVKRLSALAALGVAVLMTSGCSADEALRFGWPEGITPEAKKMVQFWQWSVIAALAMGVLVWGLIFWTITFHRRKKNASPEDEFPRQTGYNVPLELAYTAIPFVLIAILFYFTVVVQTDVTKKSDDNKVIVDVTAFQWNWKFGYQQVITDDGKVLVAKDQSKLGNPYDFDKQYKEYDKEGEERRGPAGGRKYEVSDYLRFDKIETQGTSSEIPILVLPVDTSVQFQLASADVIHSFWVPEFVYKLDVMPFPKENHQDPRFQISGIDRKGAFVGRCAEMCGEFHAMMNFELRAVDKDDFNAYITYRKEHPNASNSEALESICQVPHSVVTAPYDTRRVSNGLTPKNLGNASDTTLPNCQKATVGGKDS